MTGEANAAGNGVETAWVVAADPSVGDELVAGMREAGLNTAAMVAGKPGGSAINVQSREEMARAFKDALAQGGAPDLVLLALIPPASLTSRPLAELGGGKWAEMAEAPAAALMHTLQALMDTLEGKTFAIAVLGPTIGHVGAPGYVPLATALEAQRGIMKTAARQFGERGITVNWISVAPKAYSPVLDDEEIPHGPEMGGEMLALGHAPALRGEVAAAISLLASKRAGAITGATINIDGGEWMMP